MLNNSANHHNNGFNLNGFNGLEPESSLSEDIRRYIALFWHWAWLVISLTILIASLSFYFSFRQPRVYLSSATMLIRESRAASESAIALSNERLALTYSKMMVQQPVLEGVIQELGLQLTPGDIKRNIQVLVVPDTQLIVVRVEDTNPERAAQIANTIGTVFAEQNEASQASLYQETKQNLSTQIASTEQQIQDTLNALEALGGVPSSTNIERDLLETELEAYHNIYESLLQLVVLADLNPSTVDGIPGPEPQTLRDKLAEVNQLIENTNQQLENLGGTTETGIERDRLESNLALYRQTYANLVQSYEQVRLAEIENTSKVELVESAHPSDTPIRPNVLQATLLAAVVGLMGACGLVFLIETLDDTIKGPDDVVRHLGLPVLSVIAHIEQVGDIPVTAQHPRSPVSEAFRSLRTNIQFTGIDSPIRTLLITSPGPQDGKSTISSNLAVVIAQGQNEVILVDADLRRPSLHKKFKTSNREGLSELFLKSPVNVKEVLHPTQVPGLSILNTGALPPNPSELISTQKMREIIQNANENSDLVIFDTPPVMIVTDPSVLAPLVDGVLLVLRVGATKRSAAKFTLEQLNRTGANILGIVLNDITSKRFRYHYYNRYYNSGYYYDDLKAKPNGKRSSALG